MDAIAYLYIYIFEALILWNYTAKLFPRRTSTNSALLTLTALYLILWGISFFKKPFLNTFAFTAAAFLFLLLHFSIHWAFGAFHALIITLTMSYCELLCAYLYSHYVSSFWKSWFQPSNLLIYETINKSFYFLLTLLLIRIQRQSKAHNASPDKASFFLTAITVCLVCVTISLHLIDLNLPVSGMIETVILLTILLMLLALLFVYALHNYTLQKSEELLNLKIHLQKEHADASYYQMLSQQSENQKLLIHDIKNHLHSLAALNSSGESEKLNAYITELLASPGLQPSVHLCNRNLLNAILHRYTRRGMDLGVSFHPDIREGSTDFLNDGDLTTLFCNLLDNAFTAAAQTEHGFVNLRTEKRETPALLIFTLTNSCVQKPLRRQNGELVTSKSDSLKHGFGMKSVGRIVEKYHGEIQAYFQESEQCFHTILSFPNPGA